MDQLKLVVFGNDVGMIVDVPEEQASAAVRKARSILNAIGGGGSRIRAEKAERKQPARSLSERIQALGTEFFAEPRESTEIRKELARGAFHYDTVRIRNELRRMVEHGRLLRVGEGTKASPYKYVNR